MKKAKRKYTRRTVATSRFCVINDTINGSKRTVLSTEERAIEHARALMDTDRNKRITPTFYIVEIKKVVTVAIAPIKVTSPLHVEVDD